jgi:hypothetical protein
MRIRTVALVMVGALVLVGLAGATTAPKLKGAITSSSTISLKNSKGKTVKLLKAGRYTFVVKDTATIHNFTLEGPGIPNKEITGTSFTGTKSVTVKLKKGTYTYYCTIHPDIEGKFKVS